MIELRPSGHRAEIGYVLGRPWWGQGFMTEAARAVVEWGLAQPAMFRVWAVTDVDNVASARVLERATAAIGALILDNVLTVSEMRQALRLFDPDQTEAIVRELGYDPR